MAGLRASDKSVLADVLVLAALFAPLAPAAATGYLAAAAAIFGCAGDPGTPCLAAGLDLNQLYARSADLLELTARAGTGGMLIVYIALLAVLAQFTTEGFRGRIVRTCAVIMWAGVMPLALTLAAALEKGLPHGDGPLAAFAALGNIGMDWLAGVAVPLAVLVSGLVALTMGYRALVNRLVRLVMPRE